MISGYGTVSESLQLYYKKLPTDYQYDLFLGVVEQQCGVWCPAGDADCDKVAIDKTPQLAQEWAKKYLQPKSITITVRSHIGPVVIGAKPKNPVPGDKDLTIQPDGTFNKADGFVQIGRTDMKTIAGGAGSGPQPKTYGVAVDATTGQPFVLGRTNFKFKGGAALPMQLVVTNNWANRQIQATWAEDKNGVLDATGSAAYSDGMNKRAGYILIGVFSAGDVITFDVEDKKQWAYAEHITCKFAGKQQYAKMQCFRYGSDGFNDCAVRIVYNTVAWDKTYVWVTTSLYTNFRADRNTRDVMVNLRHVPGKYSKWPDMGMQSQTAIKGYLNAATKLGVKEATAFRGVVGVHSMERMAGDAGMWSGPGYTFRGKCADGGR